MIEQCRKDLSEIGVERRVVEISGETGEPVKSLMALLNDPPLQPQIILSTHAAFLNLPYHGGSQARGQFHLIIDEEIAVIKSFGKDLAETHRLITDHIELADKTKAHSRIRIKDKGKVKKLAEMKDDEAIAEFIQPFARRLMSSHWDNYLNTENFQKLLSGETSTFTGFSVLQPTIVEGFASVTIACALFQDTELFHVWKDKANLIPHKALMKELPCVHDNGSLITINYAVDGDWSKNLRDKDSRKLLKAILKSITDEMGDSPLLIGVNKDVSDEELAVIKNRVRLPNVSHGINSYRDHDDVAFLSARNPYPSVYNFMRFLGIDADTVRTSKTYQQAYQAILRSSIRDRNSTTKKRIFVPDRNLAEYLLSKFPGAIIKRLPGNWEAYQKSEKRGRPKRFSSGSERLENHRINKSMVTLANQYFTTKYSCNDFLIINYRNYVTRNMQCYGTDWPSIKSRMKTGDIFFENTIGFIDWLKALSERELASKDENTLISPSFFEKRPGAKTTRGVQNIVFANGIMLDNDGGGVSPDQFAEMFPELEFVAFNTFSSTKECLRYRIYIPTSRPMCAFESFAIIGEIFERMKQQGFSLAKPDDKRPEIGVHGFDTSKQNPTSLFYLPCKAKDPEGSFFQEHLEAARKPLDVDAWMKRVPAPVAVLEPQKAAPIVIPATGPHPSSPIDNEAVNRAKEVWRNALLSPGTGNSQFRWLAVQLRMAGMNDELLRETLVEEAKFARNPEERLAEIDSLVKRTYPSRRVRRLEDQEDGAHAL